MINFIEMYIHACRFFFSEVFAVDMSGEKVMPDKNEDKVVASGAKRKCRENRYDAIKHLHLIYIGSFFLIILRFRS